MVVVTIIDPHQGEIQTFPDDEPTFPTNDIYIPTLPIDFPLQPFIVFHTVSDVWIVVGTHYEIVSPNQERVIYTLATDCNWSDFD